MRRKTAVILFNLGGPNSPDGLRPFLLSLFSDRNIIHLPFFLRIIVAHIIVFFRLKKSHSIYSSIGGFSPLLSNTQDQARALEKKLNENNGEEYRVFIAMRHSTPNSAEAVKLVIKYSPDQLLLLPLYPHFDVSSTRSSFEDWNSSVKKLGVGHIPTKKVCCYFNFEKFIEVWFNALKVAVESCDLKDEDIIIVFSAHGIPDRTKYPGSYEFQIVSSALDIKNMLMRKDIDSILCYQSKASPGKWLEPSLEDLLNDIIKIRKGVIVLPLSFVSDHSETLYELDILFKNYFLDKGGIYYDRVKVPGIDPGFISALADLTINYSKKERMCPIFCSDCGFNKD